MKNLLHNHYALIKKRGLITDKTTLGEFMKKMSEEYHEAYESWADDCFWAIVPSDSFIYECTDLVMVVMNMFQHYGIDFEDELKKNIKKQESRI